MRELYRCMMKVLFCFSVAIIVGFASTVSAQLINNGDGTLTQSRVDGKILMWLQSGGPVILGWDSAMNWVSNLNAAGYTDWRMPTLDELQVLYNEERTLDNYFQNMSDYYYFTSTKYPGHNEWAYCIILAGNRAGVVSYSTLPDVSHAVLPVRDVAANQRPTITSFIATPSNGTAPLNVTFTVAASDPDGTIASVKWDFDGNGTVDETTSGLTTSFTYATSGTFTPIVTVIDNGGSTASATTGLTIVEPGVTCSQTGLIHLWPGDGNANDIVGPNNGVMMGGTTFTDGKVGQGFSFDGSGDYISLPPNNLPTYPHEFSIDAWIKTTDLGERYIIEYYGSRQSPGTFVGLGVYGGNLITSQSGDYFTGGFVADGNFHHVAVTFNGNAHYLYKDGQLVSSKTMFTQGDAITNAFIGGAINSNTYWNGVIDDLGIYNRALSQAEIKQIFDAGSNGKCYNVAPLITSFMATPSNGTAPLNVTFTVAASDPDGTISSVKWDFDGNGTVDETTSGLTTSFTYATSGTFTPIVTVIDNGGSTASATTGLTIQNPAQYTQAQVDQIVNQAVADAVRAKDIIIEQRDLTITNLNLDLNTCASQNTALSGQVSTLTANNTALSGQVSTLTAQNTALSGQVSTLTAQNTALSDQINGLTAELDNAKAKLLAAEQEIANLTHSLQSAFSDPQFFIPGSNAEKQMNNLVSAIVNLNYGQRQALYFNLGGTAGKGKTK